MRRTTPTTPTPMPIAGRPRAGGPADDAASNARSAAISSTVVCSRGRSDADEVEDVAAEADERRAPSESTSISRASTTARRVEPDHRRRAARACPTRPAAPRRRCRPRPVRRPAPGSRSGSGRSARRAGSGTGPVDVQLPDDGAEVRAADGLAALPDLGPRVCHLDRTASHRFVFLLAKPICAKVVQERGSTMASAVSSGASR